MVMQILVFSELRLMENEGVLGKHPVVQACSEPLGAHQHSAPLSEGKYLFALNEILLDCYFYFGNPILAFCLT